MPGWCQVLVIESDSKTVTQMRRVLAGMGASVATASDVASLAESIAHLRNRGLVPALIVARVTLPSGSGICLLEEAAAAFPAARHLLVSHHPKSLLLMVPGFANHCGHFLQAGFTDDQFRAMVERTLPPALRAG